jgi:hypothetical protein
MSDLNAVLTGTAGAVKVDTPSENHCEVNGEILVRQLDTEIAFMLIQEQRPLHVVEDCTAEWMSKALGRKISDEAFSTEPVGSGHMSTTRTLKRALVWC